MHKSVLDSNLIRCKLAKLDSTKKVCLKNVAIVNFIQCFFSLVKTYLSEIRIDPACAYLFSHENDDTMQIYSAV